MVFVKQDWLDVFEEMTVELSYDILNPLKTAFNLQGATSVEQLFKFLEKGDRLNDANINNTIYTLLFVLDNYKSYNSLMKLDRMYEAQTGVSVYNPKSVAQPAPAPAYRSVAQPEFAPAYRSVAQPEFAPAYRSVAQPDFTPAYRPAYNYYASSHEYYIPVAAPIVPAVQDSGLIKLDLSTWSVKWSNFYTQLSDQLPSDAVKDLNTAFRIGAPTTVREFFTHMNGGMKFIGQYCAEKNVTKLLETLSGPKYENIDAVNDLKRYVKFPGYEKLAAPAPAPASNFGTVTLDLDSWSYKWSNYSYELQIQLPSTALTDLKMAFNQGSATSVSDFFSSLNGNMTFTGQYCAAKNVAKLLSTLSGPKYDGIPLIQQIKTYVNYRDGLNSHVPIPVPQAVSLAPATCVVCLDANPTHVGQQCGHKCVCGTCALSLRSCPMCRNPTSFIRVFEC